MTLKSAIALVTIPMAVAWAVEPPHPDSPFIESIFPRGGRRGTQLAIEIAGKHLAGASAIRVSGQGVSARVRESNDKLVTAEVSIAPDAAVGRRDLRIISPRGSFVQVFEVGNLPEESEREPNDHWEQAPLVPFPTVINGKVTAKDYDHFRVKVRAGQVITFDLNSSRNGTRFDGFLSLLDLEGNEIAAQDDYYFDKDPRLVHRFAEEGEYVLRVMGFREAGSNSSDYRLTVGDMPSASRVFPAGGRRGSIVEMELTGVNLNEVDGVVLGQGPATAEVIDRSPGRARVKLEIPRETAKGPHSLWLAGKDGELPNPLVFSVSDVREVAKPRYTGFRVHPPVVINGVIDRNGAVDSFELVALAGETYSFDGAGMSLGNFLDPAILIYDADDNLVAYLDDTAPNAFDKEPPSVDFHLTHTFERAGSYRVLLRDAGKRGDPTFVYRLTVQQAQPDFELRVLTNQTTLWKGEPVSLRVRVRRIGGWDTPVDVWIDNLPQGIASRTMTADPVNTRVRGTFGEDFFVDGSNVELPLEALSDALPGRWPLVVRGRGVLGDRVVEHTARVDYPWQKTGFIRGFTHEQQIVLTLAEPESISNERENVAAVASQ